MGQEENTGCILAEEESESLSRADIELLRAGRHSRLYETFGARPCERQGVSGCQFRVWAPNAQQVSVLGHFNHRDPSADPMNLEAQSGTWSLFVPGLTAGGAYQYEVVSGHHRHQARKADPFAFKQAGDLAKGSCVWDLAYHWNDHAWMRERGTKGSREAPLTIYQVHLGSWMRVPEENNRVLTCRETAPKLADYVARLGFTHVELLPVMPHFRGNTGEDLAASFFAVDHRYGVPQDLMFLVDVLHQRGVGVILNWCPALFAPVAGGLEYFDGTHLYEQGAWRLQSRSGNPACAFNFSSPEVRSFLLSSAFFWVEKYHLDGLRLDAVGAMLYLDYGREAGEWVTNAHGGREHLAGLSFVRQLNDELHREFPEVRTLADERSAWPRATHPVAEGGLGFDYKWDHSALEDVLKYLGHDPFFRKFHHQYLTRRSSYAYTEAFVLPLSREETSAGGSSVLARLPGDEWQRFANLRLLLGFLYLQPGKKLVFMGNEFGQWQPWNSDGSLDWHLCEHAPHHRLQRWVGDLNHLYRAEAALRLSDTAATGFEWVEANDAEQSTVSWLRRDPNRREVLVVIGNFTPVVRRNYRVGVRRGGAWREILNSDAKEYGGTGQGNFGGGHTSPLSWRGFPHVLSITLPPLGIVVFKHQSANA